jgi:hypothetical protein
MKTHLFRSLFIFCIVNSAFHDISNAQLIYTDIIPDYTFSIPNTHYQLDLNNDGIIDFRFTFYYYFVGNCGFGFPDYTNCYALVSAINSNFQAANYLGIPAALNLDDTIQSWAAPDQACLLHGHWQCGSGATYFGNWNSSSDHYLAVRFWKNGDWYYGWIRMNIIGGGNMGGIGFTIRDYAYNSVPNQRIFFDPNIYTGVIEIQPGSNISIVPNPFSHSTTVRFQLLKKEKASLKIFDLNGKLITTLVDNIIEMGGHQMEINADKMNAGIYILQLQTSNLLKTEKLVVK